MVKEGRTAVKFVVFSPINLSLLYVSHLIVIIPLSVFGMDHANVDGTVHALDVEPALISQICTYCSFSNE